MKVVINRRLGGFSLSEKAYAELGLEWDDFGFEYHESEKRSNPKLVACVEKLGDEASGLGARLAVVEIPDGIEWEVEVCEGQEWIAEKHRTWR